MQKKAFVSKVFQMSSVMLIMNISNICYSIFVSKRAGAAGIGMFHLVMSIYSLAVTISVSGIGLTSTRLISDMPSPLAVKCADSVVIKCIKLCLIPASAACFFLFYASDFISANILNNPECSICLKILSPTLICTAVSSVINGYFTSFGRVGSIAMGRIFAECSVWLCTILLLPMYLGDKTYMAVVIAFCSGLIADCICSITLWRRSVNHLWCENGTDYKSILRLCTPIAIGSYLRTGLTSAENILIPSMLSLFGSTNPVAAYGIIKGMTIPILMFPTVFTGAFTSFIVPEIARRRFMGYKNGIRYISALSIEYILKFAFFVSAVFLRWHMELGEAFFDEADVGKYLGIMFVFPLFYFCDSVVDAILKGMDEQVASLKINIVDSICRVAGIVIFVPRFGVMAYLGIMYLSEFINLGFSYLKLKKSSGVLFPLKKGVIYPLLSSMLAIFISYRIPSLGMWSDICFFGAIYISILCLIQSVFDKISMQD